MVLTVFLIKLKIRLLFAILKITPWFKMADNLQRVDGRKLGFKLPIWCPKDDKKNFSYPMNCNNTYRMGLKYTGLSRSNKIFYTCFYLLLILWTFYFASEQYDLLVYDLIDSIFRMCWSIYIILLFITHFPEVFRIHFRFFLFAKQIVLIQRFW